MQGSEGDGLGNFADFYRTSPGVSGDLQSFKRLQASGTGWCVESAGLSLALGHGFP